MKIEQNEQRKRRRKIRKKEKKNHRRDGLPAEGYEGAGQGHIFVRWWLIPGLIKKTIERTRSEEK
jgi:hypothetical protein